MVDVGTLGAATGYGLLLVACLAALTLAHRLWHRSSRQPPHRWLALRLLGTVALVAFAVAVDVFQLEQPPGGSRTWRCCRRSRSPAPCS